MCGKRGGGAAAVVEGINVTVLNSADSHWMQRGGEDVEESCNNRGGKSRGHKSYDSNWAFLSCQLLGGTVSSHINMKHNHLLMRENC